MRPASGSTAKPGWLHAITNGSLTLKFLNRKRGTDAIKSIGIIPVYTGVLIHDRWAADFAYFQCKHQVCRPHLFPDLTFVFESIGYRWARLVHKLLCEICHKVTRARPQHILTHPSRTCGKEIAAKLGINLRTVETHYGCIQQKVGVKKPPSTNMNYSDRCNDRQPDNVCPPAAQRST